MYVFELALFLIADHCTQRLTVRNLRIREDTAKYLRNLDPESAYYDPKTRSMREAPDAAISPQDAVYAGDNFSRASGQAMDQEKLQLFAWQAEARGQDVHVFSNPTHAALVHKDFMAKKETVKVQSATSMLDKYGGEEYMKRPPKELTQGQSENYVEYDRSTGALIKGEERVKAVSKYAEDGACSCLLWALAFTLRAVFPGNHTSVWGSFWREGNWGFACCHSGLLFRMETDLTRI
jgi:pre-mRNA-processing factor SLU7